eukprot:COSAG02_NODE_51481_length_313_cov_154.476636_1_plen_70_part_10
MTAGDRLTTTSSDATLNVGDTIDISAHDTRIRNDGVVDVFANEAARVTTQSMSLSVGEEVQIMGGEKVVM